MTSVELQELLGSFPKLITVKEVADLFGVKPTTIYDWKDQSLLPGVVILGKKTIRFKADEIYKYLKEQSKRNRT